jgi:aarF domain-containing kinase
LDFATTELITNSWGLNNSEMFASATLARPWKAGKMIHVEKPTFKDVYESQVNAKQKLSDFLQNTDRLPKELLFVGRNLKYNAFNIAAFEPITSYWVLLLTE